MAGLLSSRPAWGQATVPYPPPGYAADVMGDGPADLAPEGSFDALEGRSPRPVAGDFFLRFTLGGGHARFSRGAEYMRATGPSMSLSTGLVLSSRLALYGEIAMSTALAPAVSTTSDHLRGGDGTALTTVAAGGGLAVLIDHHITVSLSALLTQARLVDRASGWLVARTRFGPALHLGLGKEWPLADRLGLGLELRAHGCKLADPARGASAWWGFGLLAAVRVSFS